MNTVWILVLLTVLSSGEVQVDVKYPLQPQYNTEQSCDNVGKSLANDEQLKVGLNNGTVYWKCTELPVDDLVKVSKSSSSNL